MAACSENTQSKYFEYAREVSRYAEMAPDSELAKTNIIPQYILLGDQSAGKTSILCRLAGLPLGLSANGTGTRRPFEYTFIREETCADPRITIDSTPVAEACLLKEMAKKNGRSGFTSQAVSVKVEWKEIAMHMIIVDMPGMKDGEDAPEQMVLDRLATSPCVTPVVVLDPRDMGSAHYVFKVLQRAKPKRSNSSIIALVNKCDLQMSGTGEWTNAASWDQWWRGALGKGFMHLFCVGWPCADRSSPDPDVQKDNLIKSFEHEERLIENFMEAVWSAKDAESAMGLRSFQKCLHLHQIERMEDFVQTSGPKLEAEERELTAQFSGMTHSLGDDLKSKKLNLLNSWCTEGKQLLEGKFDPHYQVTKMTLDDDFKWLLENLSAFDDLPCSHQHSKIAQELVQQKMVTKLLRVMRDSSMPFIGKAALERDIQLLFFWGFINMFRQKQIEFTEEFIKNIHSRSQEDTGNMVIKEFTARVMAQTFHPLVEVLCLLVWRHVESSLVATFHGMEEEGRDWKHLYKTFQDTTLLDEFKREVQKFTKALVDGLNLDLHGRLEDQAGALQGANRSSARSRTLATNTAGIHGLDAHQQKHDQVAKRNQHGHTTCCFLYAWMVQRWPVATALHGPSVAVVLAWRPLLLLIYLRWLRWPLARGLRRGWLGRVLPGWLRLDLLPFPLLLVWPRRSNRSTLLPLTGPPGSSRSKHRHPPAQTGVAHDGTEFRSRTRRFLSLASQELAQTGKEGEQLAQFADSLQAGLGLLQGQFWGNELQEILTEQQGSASWDDAGKFWMLSPSERDPAILLRSSPFGINSGTAVSVTVKRVSNVSVTHSVAGQHADVARLGLHFAGIALRDVVADTWLAGTCIPRDSGEMVILTLSHELRELAGRIVVLELIATSGACFGVESVGIQNSEFEMPTAPSPGEGAHETSQDPHADMMVETREITPIGQHFQAMMPFYETMQRAYQVPREIQTRGMDVQKLHNDTSYELIWQLVEFRKIIDQRVACLRKNAVDTLFMNMIEHIRDDCIQRPLKQARLQQKRLSKRREVLQSAMHIRRQLLRESDSSDNDL